MPLYTYLGGVNPLISDFILTEMQPEAPHTRLKKVRNPGCRLEVLCSWHRFWQDHDAWLKRNVWFAYFEDEVGESDG